MSDRTLRERQNEAANLLDRSAPATIVCSAAMVAQTFTKDVYPAGPGTFYACHPILITGTEGEGDSPTFTVDTDTTIYVLNVGSSTPPSGTKIVCHLGSGRWTTRWDG